MSKASALTINGIGASPGVALGRAYTIERSRVSLPKYRLPGAEEVQAERMRLKTALELSYLQLNEIKAKVPEATEHALILEAHMLMLKDPMFVEEAFRIISEENVNAEWAVRRVVKKLKTAFEDIQDDYFRERRADIEFVGDRVLRNLLGQVVDVDPEGDGIPPGCIIVAHDLSPADATVLMRRGQVAGFVTDMGAQTSHMAILARAREIPGVVGAARASEAIKRGDLVAIDGHQGTVVVNPNEEQVRLFQEAMRRHLATEQAMLRIRDLPAVTADGVRLGLMGNLELSEQVPSLLSHGAEGIGLYRTEFLYLEREGPPTEEEHYMAYRSVIEGMQGRPVTIRTLDLGADKVPRSTAGKKRGDREANPALGLRAVRYCLKHREVFLTQLRGILRASVHGNVRIMFPMISALTELREAKAVLEYAKEELTRAGQPFAPKVPVGVMVETPAAAFAADKLALECDFFSIGTNDLIQYSLAIDRQNREVAYLYRPLHIAILRMVKFIVESAHAAGISVSMCGEMAGDPMYTLVMLGFGLDELSMVASQIPVVKRIIRNSTAEDARKLLDEAMKLNTAHEIERYVRTEMQLRFGEALLDP